MGLLYGVNKGDKGLAYPPIFWDRVRDVFAFSALSEERIAFDLGLDRKHLREVAQKMEWKRSCTKPRIPELVRRLNFLLRTLWSESGLMS